MSLCGDGHVPYFDSTVTPNGGILLHLNYTSKMFIIFKNVFLLYSLTH